MNAFASPNLDRQDIVLLIADGAEGPYPLDPIRVMKACFLVAQRGTSEWKQLFDFRPYDYGPFDSRVYTARDNLLSNGLLSEDSRPRHGAYNLTAAGHEQVANLRRGIGDQHADWFRQIGRYVTSRSFSDLLDEIYAAFPDFATRSRYARS